MILPNVSKRSYTWTLNSVASKSGSVQDTGIGYTQSFPFVLTSRLAIGLGSRLTPTPSSLFPIFNLTVERFAFYNVILGIDQYQYRIRLSVYSAATGSSTFLFDTGKIAGWLPTTALQLKIDGADFDVTACWLAWTFTCDNIRLIVDGTTVYNRGSSYSVNADYYEPRVNISQYSSSMTNGSNIPYTSCCFPIQTTCESNWNFQSPCGDTFPFPSPNTPKDVSFNVQTSGIWQAIEDGTGTIINPQIELYSFGDPGGSCTCEIGMPTTNNTISTESEFSVEHTSVLESTLVCEHIIGLITRHRFNGYRTISDVYYKYSLVQGVDKVASYNNTSYKESKETCNSSVWSVIVDGADPVSYSAQEQVVTRSTRNQLCWCSIPAIGQPLSPEGCPPVNSDVLCNYTRSNKLQWNTPTCGNPTANEQPDIIHDSGTNEYYFTFIRSGNVWVQRALHTSPIGGWNNITQVTSTGNCAKPCLGLDTNGTLRLLYELSGTGVVARFSLDQGYSWSSASTMFTNGKQPRIAISSDGQKVFAAFKYNSGSSGPGKIFVISQGPGDALPAEVAIKDSSGNDLVVTDTGFDISFSNDLHGTWLLACTKDGETAVKHFVSHDYLKTVTELP